MHIFFGKKENTISEQKFVQHGQITIAIDCNDLFLRIFVEKWPNYAFGQKSAPNSDSFCMRWLFNVCVWVLRAPNAKILLVYIHTCKLFRIKHTTLLEGETFFRNKSEIEFFLNKVHIFFGRKENTIIMC